MGEEYQIAKDILKLEQRVEAMEQIISQIIKVEDKENETANAQPKRTAAV